MTDDFITFTDEPVKTGTGSNISRIAPWKLLVVDDDPEVHSVTRFVLDKQKILGRPLNLIYADSAREARERLMDNPDVAVALLDVVMETEYAGLDLVKFIRSELQMDECRLILRTGQPGYAPEVTVIHDYDINDYRTKSELTHTRLITTISAALRSYEQLHALAEHRRGLELIIHAASDLLEQHAIADLAEGVLTQLAALLKLSASGIVVTHRGSPLSDDRERTYIVGAAGRHAAHIAQPLDTLPELRIVNAIQECTARRSHLFGDDFTVLYLQTSQKQDAAIFLDTGESLAALDRQLLDVFVANISACFRNVKLVEKLNHIAYHDPLTKLMNRHGFITALDSSSCSMDAPVIALIDLDHFTDLNDGLGHEFGDTLLISVARRLEGAMQPGCNLARIAADIFGVIGPPAVVNEENLLNLFIEPIDTGGYQIPVSVSLGLCRLDEKGRSGIDLLKMANIALNLTKKSSAARHEYFMPEMEEQIRQRVEIIRQLRKAVNTEQLQVWYQPQISVTTGEVTGLEALLRWPEGKGFAHPPTVFIPLAEYSGLIFRIGEWALQQSCMQYRELAKAGFDKIRMAVNVSMPQFQKAGFAETVAGCLSDYGIPPEMLELEITESIAMDEPRAVKEKLDRLRGLGIQIAIDDFGTGYSSLSQLQSIPIDYLKIDRAFIMEIQGGRKGIFAETIVDFCRKLGVLSIAEGVETEEQAEFLKNLGCDIIQGYLYAKPMPPDQLMSWLHQRKS